MTYQELLLSDQAFTTTLVTMLVDIYGTECFSWAPETILLELESDLHVQPAPGNVDRMMAGKHLLTSNSFYTSLPDFNDLCSILSGEPLTAGVFVPADAASIAWGITEALFLSPPHDMNSAFTDDIRAFIGEVVKDEGIITPPDVLRIAKIDKDLMKQINYDFSEDVDIFSGIFQNEKEKTDNINHFVKMRLRSLIFQLSELPLKHGSAVELAEKMLQQLPGEADPALPAPL